MLNDPILLNHHQALSTHSMYGKISTLDHLKIMMETHAFAVWDFMGSIPFLVDLEVNASKGYHVGIINHRRVYHGRIAHPVRH